MDHTASLQAASQALHMESNRNQLTGKPHGHGPRPRVDARGEDLSEDLGLCHAMRSAAVLDLSCEDGPQVLLEEEYLARSDAELPLPKGERDPVVLLVRR